jgi:hypothetical protein
MEDDTRGPPVGEARGRARVAVIEREEGTGGLLHRGRCVGPSRAAAVVQLLARWRSRPMSQVPCKKRENGKRVGAEWSRRSRAATSRPRSGSFLRRAGLVSKGERERQTKLERAGGPGVGWAQPRGRRGRPG